MIHDCVQFPRRGWLHSDELFDSSGEAPLFEWHPCLALPLLSLVGLPEPLRVNNMGFDAATVDAVLERLAILRGQR